MPYKILNAFTYNLTLYFMTNLRREPGPFFFFLFITFLVTLCMSMIFRTIASASRTLSQAMVPAALLILALVTFTGFVIQIDYMLGWCRWINYVNPLAYAFESLMVNEFHNRKFECNLFIPTYPDAAPENRVCSTVGAVQGEPMVSGDRYINLSFSYYHAHKWRNVGIVIAFTLLFLATYMFFAETVSAKKSKGEVLVFRRGHRLAKNRVDAESSPAGRVAITEKEGYGEGQPSNFKSTSVFHWNNVCYDIKIKSENRRILDNVAGWVKPGTMTALMVHPPSTPTIFNTNKPRAFQEPVKQPSSTVSPTAQAWALSTATSSSTTNSATPPSNAKQATSSNKTCTYLQQQSAKPSTSPP